MSKVRIGNENTAARIGRAVQRVEGTPFNALPPLPSDPSQDPIPMFIGVVSESTGIAPGGFGAVTPWTYASASSAFAQTARSDDTVYDWFDTGADQYDKVMYFRHRLSGRLIMLRTTYVLYPGSST